MTEQSKHHRSLLWPFVAVLVFQFCIGAATYSFTIRFIEFHDRHSQADLREAISAEQVNHNAKVIAELQEIGRQQKAMIALMRGQQHQPENTVQTEQKESDPTTEIVDLMVDADDFDILRDMTPGELNLLDRRIRDDRVRRFEESLDEQGLKELDTRYHTRLEQMRTGTVPGFEGYRPGREIPQDGPHAERFHANVKEMVLTEMYMEKQFEEDMKAW